MINYEHGIEDRLKIYYDGNVGLGSGHAYGKVDNRSYEVRRLTLFWCFTIQWVTQIRREVTTLSDFCPNSMHFEIASADYSKGRLLKTFGCTVEWIPMSYADMP